MDKKVDMARRYIINNGKILTDDDTIYITILDVPSYFKEACTILCNCKNKRVSLSVGKINNQTRYEFTPRKDKGATMYILSENKYYTITSAEQGFKITDATASDMYKNEENVK